MGTEDPNPETADLDVLDAAGIVARLHREDRRALEAVHAALPAVARAAAAAAEALAGGGRLLYVGAGTSGRLGALDASELPPTFGLDPARARALIAGGPGALLLAVEGAEDDTAGGAGDVRGAGAGPGDLLLCLAASGRTPYVLGAAAEGRRLGARTVGVLCSPGAPLESLVDIPVVADTGPEALLGSTRLKAATAQKLILHAISTAAGILDGHAFGNLLVDMRPTNGKLRARAVRAVALAAPCTPEEAAAALAEAGGEIKTAILMRRSGAAPAEARARLRAAGGHLRRAIEP